MNHSILSFHFCNVLNFYTKQCSFAALPREYVLIIAINDKMVISGPLIMNTNMIMLKCNSHEDKGQIYIQIVTVLHGTECKPKNVAMNLLDNVDSVRFAE